MVGYEVTVMASRAAERGGRRCGCAGGGGYMEGEVAVVAAVRSAI